MKYPKRNIMDPCCILEQWICESQLTKCLDGLRLHSICFSGGCFVGTVVEEDGVDAVPDQVASLLSLDLLSVFFSGKCLQAN